MKSRFILSLCLLGCSSAVDRINAPIIHDDDMYAIHSVVLNSLFLGSEHVGSAPPRFVISDSTIGMPVVTESDLDYVRAKFRVAHAAQFDAVERAMGNEALGRIGLDVGRFRTGAPVELVSRADLESLAQPNFWDAFYARFPGARGRITLGTPLIDRTGKYALMRYGHGCGWLCGDYGYILLEKTTAGWTVLQRVITVMS
jgi:hypothetical protein